MACNALTITAVQVQIFVFCHPTLNVLLRFVVVDQGSARVAAVVATVETAEVAAATATRRWDPEETSTPSSRG